MTRNEMIVLKMNILGGMNDYVLDVIGDEELTNMWLMCGVPDGATEDDLRELAEDEELWLDCINTFKRVCTYARII